MTPAERLIAAAGLLEKRAGEATDGPWTVHLKSGLYGRQAWVGGPGVTTDGLFIATAQRTPEGPSDAVYIATMHPEVGKALAAWLREEAAFADLTDLPSSEFAEHLADLLLAGAA